jgi:Large eukaryotic DNA virus major capsid protein/Major capsid protein N-terminus
MTGGGLLQLVAYGAQDVYLTANPQVTFFKQLYRRHSNFAMESVEQTFNGVANFGRRVQCTIARNGDLIGRTYVQATLPSVDLNSIAADTSGTQFRWLNFIGENLINSVEIEIGGQRIDIQYGDWLHIWNELTCPPGKQPAYMDMIGNVPELTNVISNVGPDGGCSNDCVATVPHMSQEVRSCTPQYTLYVPLKFWFCRHTGLSLPLIALQYHDIRINIEFNDLRNLCWTNNPQVLDTVNNYGLVACSLYVDYFYLDTEERRRFAQVAHEYLIEQLQFAGDESLTASVNRVKMSFSHPVKELIWVIQRDDFVSCLASVIDQWKGQQPFNYSDYWDRAVLDSGYACGTVNGMAGADPVVSARIQLNGQDRFSEREGRYFNVVQPYQHHTTTPSVGINVYSFALNPEDHQPSGSCNFSRIDNANLFVTLSPNTLSGSTQTCKIRIYATNYNVLRVMAGMGGLAYAN